MSEFATDIGSKEAEMEINGCACTFNSPKAKKNGEARHLPPYAPRKAYMVDEYPGCPTDWMHGSSKAKSYFVPIQNEHGMWLDFNKCFQHTHHIAVLISVQGVNPLTGDPMIDTAMRLEQYKHKCPRHDKEFGADLYCEECGYKWVPQNYLSTTGTPNGMLWLDGFRADDGSVRQYYFTEEECKGIAAQIIGDKRVFAIGIAFYESKERKPKISSSALETIETFCMPKQGKLESFGGAKYKKEASWVSNTKDDGGIVRSFKTEALEFNSSFERSSVQQKQLEIGAGAKIDQHIYRDPESLEFWQEVPTGMLYINYIQEKEAKQIISIGKKDMTKKGEGFLAGLNFGNN